MTFHDQITGKDDRSGAAPLLRPEPLDENRASDRGGPALFGVTLAVVALLAIYQSSPVDLPEWTDCPIQSIGSCGR